MKTKTEKIRRLLLVLPLLVIPFLALAFYAFKQGGKSLISHPKGINIELPDAKFKEADPATKMGFYQQQSAQRNGKKQMDTAGLADQFLQNDIQQNAQTDQITQKLQQIDQQLNGQMEPKEVPQSKPIKTENNSMTNDVDRLEALMQTIQNPDTKDPEMMQLSSMLDKIMSVQNPELTRLQLEKERLSNPDSLFKAIPAVVVDRQRAVQDVAIKLMLQDSVVLKGQIIPKGQVIYGIARIANQRLFLDIKNIRMGNAIIPVNLTVYDLDGMKGIDAPEALITQSVNNGTGDAIGSLQLLETDPSIKGQLVGAGIQATKGFLGRKVKNIKVKLDAGQKVLLRNNDLKININNY
jgi:hypothetical protein